MANPLIQQVRINKNGVAVTKHVKTPSLPSAALRNVPAPMPAGVPKPSVTHAERLQQVLNDISTSADANYLDASIRNTEDDSLLRLLEEASSDLGRRPEDRSLRKALRAIVRMATPEAVEKHLRAVVVLKGAVRPDLLNRVIAGMDANDTLRPYADRLNEAPPEVQEKARTTATVISLLANAGEHGFNSGGKKFYVHPKLEAAILANPERIKEYAEFCAARGSAEALDEIDSVQPAVRSGLL